MESKQKGDRRYLFETFTLTFGDQAENHKGMQKIGTMAESGFQIEDLQKAKEWFESKGAKCEIAALHEGLKEELRTNELNSYVLIARKGLNAVLETEKGDDLFFNEQKALNKDRKAFMYGRVVNKHARHNLCFGEEAQDADYQSGKGTIIPFSILEKVRNTLNNVVGKKAEKGNYYYDVTKCGIGFHGDTERRLVIGIRVGTTFPLHYV